MTGHLEEGTLNDYVDALLEPPVAARVAAHLRECQSCAGQAAALRALVDEVRSLPGEILPARDLRPAIRGILDARGTDASPVAPSHAAPRAGAAALWKVRYALAAAAVLLIALSAVMTRWAMRPGPTASLGSAAQDTPGSRAPAPGPRAARAPEPTLRAPAPAAPPTMPGASAPPARAELASFRREEGRYMAGIEALQRDLDSRSEQLSPTTLRILQHNLDIIDRALRESRAALARDPSNRILAPLILSAYEQKLELLRRARESSS